MSDLRTIGKIPFGAVSLSERYPLTTGSLRLMGDLGDLTASISGADNQHLMPSSHKSNASHHKATHLIIKQRNASKTTMKLTAALAIISVASGASAQLSKKPLRGGAKDLAEDEAAHTARVLQGSMSMVQGDAEYAWDGKWPATTTEATEVGDWADWKGNSKASKSTTSSKGSKDWWSAAPTVSNVPSSEKEWSAGKSGKSSSTKSGKSSSKDSWGKPEPVRTKNARVLCALLFCFYPLSFSLLEHVAVSYSSYLSLRRRNNARHLILLRELPKF